MNEQRQEAYLNLINSLLNCPSEEEPEILAANAELVDAGLVQMMLAVAEMTSQQGDENVANWLRNFAWNLTPLPPSPSTERGEMNLTPLPPSPPAERGEMNQAHMEMNLTPLPPSPPAERGEMNQTHMENNSPLPVDGEGLGEGFHEYLQLLMEILKATSDSDANPQVIYPLLAANTAKLDDIFAEILRRWAIQTLAPVETDTATSIAVYIVKFSNLIQQFPLGSKASNMEIAIAGYEVVGNIFTPTTFPQEWASTQNNLGNAYSDRILGDKAKNLESAIASYNAALKIRTETAFPQEWASTQNNLGNAYSDRILGDKAKNLESAIASYNAALKIRTETAFPQDWAMTQNNLGNAYLYRIRGDKAENLESAIASYNAALKIRTETAFPQQWATTQNNLAAAYLYRIRGDKAENLESAIASYNAALKILTETAFPQDWATTQNNLGTAYSNRIRGDKAENLESAIASYNAALKIRTETAFPQEWATTQNNLGNAYSNRIRGDKAENLESAIASYNAALKIRTETAFPQDWATTQNNLGNAYRNRIRGDKAENLESAIASYNAALKIRTETAFPQEHAETAFSLGVAYQDKKDFDSAYQTFADAINTVETMRGDIVSGEEIKRKQSEEWNQLYRGMVEVCLDLGKETEAIEYAERSKTRNLVELILERDFHTIFPPDVLTKLEHLRDEIASGQNQIQTGKAENPQELAQHLQKLRQQRNELQDKYLPVGYGFNLKEFQATLDEHTAVIQWYITNTSVETFIITRDSQQRVNISNRDDNLDALINWRNEYLRAYYLNKTEWKDNLASLLTPLAEILHIKEVIKSVPKSCSRLVLIPHLYLHLFPLHALPIADGEFLCDQFSQGVSYTPSCQLLQQLQKRSRPNFESLFAVQNPTEDLVYTDLEVQVIKSYFQSENVLKKSQATLSAINNANLNAFDCAHFSCHGYFNLVNPRKSALLLANSPVATASNQLNKERYLEVRAGETHDLEKCLTLDAIFSLKLEKCRLVTLSACETGLVDFSKNSDEYIGLPSGFIVAGSQAVVSSLWTVSDLSTAFLMMKFYENIQNNLSVVIAINEAQKWLRNLTKEEFETILHQYQAQIDETLAQMRPGQRKLFQEYLKRIRQGQSLPFANPYYWAAFTAAGV
jgi:CHAT domain-containing protein